MLPVYEALQSKGLFPWIDQHHYPAGMNSFDALREEIASSRHVVYFITSALLRLRRGWVAVERAYASLMQQHLTFGSIDLCHVELPILFVPQSHPVLLRSIWAPILQRAAIWRGSSRASAGQVEWAAKLIERFVRKEQKWGLDLAENIEIDEELQRLVASDANLRDRIVAAAPAPVPPP